MPTNQMDTMEQKLDRWDTLDQFDRNQVYNWLMMLNQNERYGIEIMRKAKEKGII